ncbi:MAG: ATP-binding cassette domain-containing protein [Spirochaetales bacterium]|jgi:ABC-type branched-subunit amino acid transport system ATPase component|nr:ATP-binding cassette domain-containing protein [Spirochaetales bacterium]
MLLSVDRINVAYGPARVLSEVTLNLDSGERVFVVGRNGAGKTTLLKTIAGFLTPTSGDILFDGDKVNALSPEQMANRGVRYVYQDKRVFTKLTVRENIQLAAFASNEKLDVAIARVVQVYPKITQFLDTKAGGLSGGQKQLLLLGRALIGHPKVLLIDEPTEGLAAGIIEEVFKVLEMIKGQVSMIIVEQNLAVVCALADRVYAMKEGRIQTQLTNLEEIQDNAILEQYL